MALTVSHTNSPRAPSTGSVTQLQKIADNICQNALAETYDKLVPGEKALKLEALLQRRALFQSFKYSLAKGVAQALAEHDRRVQAVYLFQLAANPEVEAGEFLPLETTIHLLVRVETSSAALDAFTASLDRGLAQCLQQLSTSLFTGCDSILDVILLTEEAIERQTGYASLLSSMFAPPLELWQRQA